jgi:hypothetical protein
LTYTVNRSTENEPWTTRTCKKTGWVVVEVHTGKVMDADCDTGTCQVCGVRRAKARAAAITWQQRRQDRSRLVTLTDCPVGWQERRTQLFHLRSRLQKAGHRVEWIWTTEAGAKTGMIHVHAIQHGSYIPQKELQDAWGGRIVDVRAVHDAAEYISKSASRVAGYITKGAADERRGLAIHLGLNGGRLHHWSRQFFGGMSIREAVSASRGDRPDAVWVPLARDNRSDRELVHYARWVTERDIDYGPERFLTDPRAHGCGGTAPLRSRTCDDSLAPAN